MVIKSTNHWICSGCSLRECHYISLILRTLVSFPSCSESCIWCPGVFFTPWVDVFLRHIRSSCDRETDPRTVAFSPADVPTASGAAWRIVARAFRRLFMSQRSSRLLRVKWALLQWWFTCLCDKGTDFLRGYNPVLPLSRAVTTTG